MLSEEEFTPGVTPNSLGELQRQQLCEINLTSPRHHRIHAHARASTHVRTLPFDHLCVRAAPRKHSYVSPLVFPTTSQSCAVAHKRRRQRRSRQTLRTPLTGRSTSRKDTARLKIAAGQTILSAGSSTQGGLELEHKDLRRLFLLFHVAPKLFAIHLQSILATHVPCHREEFKNTNMRIHPSIYLSIHLSIYKKIYIYIYIYTYILLDPCH